jgi:hypothetical protein
MNVAVVDAIDDYIDQSARFAFQEFDVLRVIKDQVESLEDLEFDAPVSRMKLQYRDRIRDRITEIKSQTQIQYHTLFEHTVQGDEAVADCLDECLASDPFYDNVVGGRREDYADDMRQYLVGVSDAIEPLLLEEGDVWDAVRATCEPEEAKRRLREPFRRCEVIGRYEDDIAMLEDTTELPLLSRPLDYTKEARRIFDHGEDYIHRIIGADVDRAFEED